MQNMPQPNVQEEQQELTSYQPELLVNQRVLPGSKGAVAMTVGSGRRLIELSENSNRNGLSLKMLKDYLLLKMEWHSTICYLTWKPLVTNQKRLLFQLAVSTPRTGEIESSLWATPQSEKTTPNTKDTKDLVNSQGEPLKRGQKSYDRRTSNPITTALADQVKMWPTPQERDHKDRGSNTDYEKVAEKRKLPGAVGGQLNPPWVEGLMGFPIGYTDIAEED